MIKYYFIVVCVVVMLLVVFIVVVQSNVVVFLVDQQLVQCGEYLVKVGDCVVCYIVKGGKFFVGGLFIVMFIGMVYLFNIMLDKDYGIGNYSEEDFDCVLCYGICKDGVLFYLVMLYFFYVKVKLVDVKVFYVYFMQGVQVDFVFNCGVDIIWLLLMCWLLLVWCKVFVLVVVVDGLEDNSLLVCG